MPLIAHTIKSADGADVTSGPRAQHGDVAAMRAVIAALALAHNFKVHIRTNMPPDTKAYATWATRTITIPPITDEISFARALHEAAHLIAGPCPEREPHCGRSEQKQYGEVWRCLECEVAAWRIAATLVPFSSTMQLTAHRSLIGAMGHAGILGAM